MISPVYGIPEFKKFKNRPIT